MIVEVDSEKCTGCGVCIDVCPAGAVNLEKGCAYILTSHCKCCGACAVECPPGAISLQQSDN
jgi:MinD superfamily P-loop ATPase